MKIYIKELGKEESIQILNTSTDNFSMPRVGDTILVSYVVSKVEWVSFKGRNGSAILWVTKREDNQVKVSIWKKVRNGVWKSNDKEEVLLETSIERTQLPEALIPRIGEKMEVGGKVYEVLEVTKVGGLFNFGELRVIVHEISG